MEHILEKLSHRYPQLLLPVAAGMSKSPAFTDAVYRGKRYDGVPDYSLSEKDRFSRVDTPAGPVDVLLLHERVDFEKCACALANRCEPKPLPRSVGAFMISGLTDWEKVRKYLDKGPQEECLVNSFLLNWLKRDHPDILSRIILLSSGWYSGIAPERLGLSGEDWTEKSVTLRMYHEIAHFVCRSRYPKDIQAIRDEVFADMIGIVAAFGRFDAEMAKVFLGIDGDTVPDTARIRYYLKDRDEGSAVSEAEFWISWLENMAADRPEKEIDDLIVGLFDEMRAAAFDGGPQAVPENAP